MKAALEALQSKMNTLISQSSVDTRLSGDQKMFNIDTLNHILNPSHNTDINI